MKASEEVMIHDVEMLIMAAEMENIKKFRGNYLALQSTERSKNIAAGRPTE
ncbi:MAG: hypothetical protein PF485_05180 [Bacteroidales bacterium]|jgi:hypothetical protein|nr:hypothetical protein [Bacteroidales bacterium]